MNRQRINYITEIILLDKWTLCGYVTSKVHIEGQGSVKTETPKQVEGQDHSLEVRWKTNPNSQRFQTFEATSTEHKKQRKNTVWSKFFESKTHYIHTINAAWHFYKHQLPKQLLQDYHIKTLKLTIWSFYCVNINWFAGKGESSEKQNTRQHKLFMKASVQQTKCYKQ